MKSSARLKQWDCLGVVEAVKVRASVVLLYAQVESESGLEGRKRRVRFWLVGGSLLVGVVFFC